MWMAIGALASAASSLIGSAAASGAASDQNKLTAEQIKTSRANQVDARGNQTIYDPDTNSFTTYTSADTKKLLDATDRETLQTLTNDAPLYREALNDASVRRQDESRLADALMDKYKGLVSGDLGSGNSEQSLEAALLRSRLGGNTEATQSMASGMLKQGVRSGASGLTDAMQKLGTQLREANTGSAASAGLEAKGMHQQYAGTALNDALSNYSGIANRADSLEVNPSVPGSQAGNSLNSALSNALAASSQGLKNASGSNTAAFQMLQQSGQNMGTALNSLSNGVGNFFKSNNSFDSAENERMSDWSKGTY
jgi:hypothetical protein